MSKSTQYLLTLALFIALGFAPIIRQVARDLTTSWEPVGLMYPTLVKALTDTSDGYHDVFACLSWIAAHIGVSFGMPAALSWAFSRTKTSSVNAT